MAAQRPSVLQEALRQSAGCLDRRFGARLRHVRLFGSWSRGRAHPGSDVDVAVVEALHTSGFALGAPEIRPELDKAARFVEETREIHLRAGWLT